MCTLIHYITERLISSYGLRGLYGLRILNSVDSWTRAQRIVNNARISSSGRVDPVDPESWTRGLRGLVSLISGPRISSSGRVDPMDPESCTRGPADSWTHVSKFWTQTRGLVDSWTRAFNFWTQTRGRVDPSTVCTHGFQFTHHAN